MGTLPLTGFELQYQRDDDDTDNDWTDATTVTISLPETESYDHENVEGGMDITWEYRVRAVNGHGAGPWTDVMRRRCRGTRPQPASPDRNGGQQH